MIDQLPPGWATVSLSDIADINPRHSRDLEDDLVVSFAPMPALSAASPKFDWLQERPLGEVRKGFTHFAEGDVLFAKITPCMENGKAAVATQLRNALGCGTTELHILRPRHSIDPHFVYHFIHQPSFRRAAEASFTGSAGQARVPVGFVEEAKIPVAPTAEQRRIVAKLETLLGKVDACQQRLANIPVLLKRFRQSVLAAACSGRLTADWRQQVENAELTPAPPANLRLVINVEPTYETPPNWRWLPLVSLCEPTRSICYGVIKLGKEDPKGVPCLRTSDVKPLRIDATSVKRISPNIAAEYRRTLLRGGEILVNVRGTLGGVAVVPAELRDWNISREVALVPISGVVPEFVAFWIASLPSQNWLTGVAKGVAYTGINIEDLRLLPVSLPPLAEQHELVRRVEALFSAADRIESRYVKAAAHVEKLTQSILARAFRGDLVPQDRTDEPASVLLERIRQERHAGRRNNSAVTPRKRKTFGRGLTRVRSTKVPV